MRRGRPRLPRSRGLGDARGERCGDRPPRQPEALPPAPAATPPVTVAERCGRGAERWGNEGSDHQSLPPAYLRPPSPEKTPPGPTALTGAGPAAPEPEGGSAMLLGGHPDNRSPPRPGPPTRPHPRPRSRRVAGVGRNCGGGGADHDRDLHRGPVGPEPEVRPRRCSGEDEHDGQDLPPAPAAFAPLVAESRGWAAVGEGDHNRELPRGPTSPEPEGGLGDDRRDRASGRHPHARPPPRPRSYASRSRRVAVQRNSGGGGGSSSGSPPRPTCALPRRKKRPPGWDLRSGRNGRPRQLRSRRWSRRCSAPRRSAPPRPRPPTRPPQQRPGPQRVAAVRRSVGGTRGPILIISPRTACALPRRKKRPPGRGLWR